MNVLVANLAGVKIEADGSVKHYIKAGSRWPMTIGTSRSVDYYPFPFWLAYASALLKRDTKAHVRGLDGVVLDLTSEELFSEIVARKPGLLVVELTSLTLEEDLSFLARIKAATGCAVVVCGNYATVTHRDLAARAEAVDYVARGEYEMTVRDLVNALVDGADLSGVAGLTWRKDGEVAENPARPLLADLDELPFPDRDDFPATIYPDFTLYSPCINILSSRGCPCGCVYCQERHVMYASPKYRVRSGRKVAEEMAWCVERFGARQFYFDDQSFVVNKKHVLDVCREIKALGLTTPWTVMGDAMFVDREMLEAMAGAGCIGMKFGVESADASILKAIGKPLDLAKAKQVAKWCKELGIRTHATFCMGLPGETEETIRKSMAYMEELEVDTAQVSKAVPYPGTPMYEWALKNGYLATTDLARFDGMGDSVMSYPGLSNADIDRWYALFSRRVARKKVLKYLFEPGQSFSIMAEMVRRKGVASLAKSLWTFVRRAF
ncbi:2-hydroxyethylphosphonate methyltransferase [Fundidesulfovibrio magnetotacticus]|uniref:2-hydroxyethylphosphonate methyltransferase n=1 Tax=Fundidesulfovibrio magnetotacticus TaxID=2730080 RepID=A0A6V8LRW1_9BACT|nr:radical SAM protein [Fundidesulfovibrio magnetotacticus]GFK95203.1 2-hydroxyethylphosphonate methyltransferase [Fundidesulfovibrio magnetotacticus]